MSRAYNIWRRVRQPQALPDAGGYSAELIKASGARHNARAVLARGFIPDVAAR